MKSNGFGSLIQKIEFKVPVSQAAKVASHLTTEAGIQDDNAGSASFTVQVLTTKPGDDEMVVWKLISMLPVDVTFRIDWGKSEY